jgi:L-alanine-DL-glutamate epimerase-like enolase superfamily enzyme
MRVEVAALAVPWRTPLLTAHGADVDAPRPLLLLALTGEDGVSGYGEAAPLEGYDGVSLQAVQAALARCEPALAASDGSDREPLLRRCEALAGLPETLAAIDMALWDLAGRRAGEPVWKLLGGAGGHEVAVNATIGAERPSQAAVESAAAAAAGFDCVKVKVGDGEDELRLAAVRAAIGARALIRVDANGAWTVPRAVDTLAALRVYELELCEEPVHGLDGLEAVAVAAAVPVAADESAREPGVFSRRVCEAVCLKIARCGGISGVVRDAAAARAAGYEVYVSSTLDGPLGIAAALHASAAIAPDRHCGLATLGRFDRPDPMPPGAGTMSAPAGAGLGDGLVGWYGAR